MVGLNFAIRGRHNNLGSYYLSQSCFDLPERSRWNSNIKVNLFTQTIEDIEIFYIET